MADIRNTRNLAAVPHAVRVAIRTFRRRLSSPPPEIARLKLQYLREVDIFRDLTAEELAWLKDTTRMVTFRAGETIFDQAEEAEVLFILKRGRVQLYRITRDGKKIEIDTIGPGTFFGEMPFISQRMHETFAEALEDSLVCIMSRSEVERLILAKPQVAIRMLEVLSARLADQAERLEVLAFQSVTERLAATLLRIADGRDAVQATHQELADVLGVYRETVTKLLDSFQREGLVNLERRRVTLVDRAGLERAAGK